MATLRILAMEPYYGGSHRAFLDGWSARSRHEWTLLTLPAHHWKWRMRHAAVTFAERLAALPAADRRRDVLWCSDMLDLPALLALARGNLGDIPAVAYFHENQLTYPDPHADERDVHFGVTNFMTALAADEAWFNTAWHRDSFLAAVEALLTGMPDFPLSDAVARAAGRCRVLPPGVEDFPPRGPRAPGPARLLWAARWEHDKNPEAFFEALERLVACGIDFRVSVIGEQFRDAPEVFERTRKRLAGRIDRWGYQPTRETYREALREADVIVSTAMHEFFGISVVEAVAAGAYPVLPRRLAYPEVLADAEDPDAFFYDGGADALADKLAEVIGRIERGDLWQGDPHRAARAMRRYAWDQAAPRLDEAIERVL